MAAPDLQWHDRSSADSERYEWTGWPTIRAVVTRLRTSVEAGYQESVKMYGRAAPAPRSFTTCEQAQERAQRTIKRRLPSDRVQRLD